MRLRAGEGSMRQRRTLEVNDGSNTELRVFETRQLDNQPALWATIIVSGDLLG